MSEDHPRGAVSRFAAHRTQPPSRTLRNQDQRWLEYAGEQDKMAPYGHRCRHWSPESPGLTDILDREIGASSPDGTCFEIEEVDIMRHDGESSMGFLSTYPPTTCGLATFTASLRDAFVDRRGSDAGLGVVSLVDQPVGNPSVRWYTNTSTAAQPRSRQAIEALNAFDVTFIQHEYGIYGGPDGSEVLDLLAGLKIPAVVTLHTVLSQPSPAQRSILEQVVARAERTIVMSDTAYRRLSTTTGSTRPRSESFRTGHVISLDGPSLADGTRPLVLTWGLIGPGQGSGNGDRRLRRLRDLQPLPRYVILGKTHPKVQASQGDAYLEGLVCPGP